MRALVLSGGGCKGAYEAGAIRWLLGSAGIQYQIVCGVSVGALNAAAVCMHPVGGEVLAADSLDELWGSVRIESVYSEWPIFGKVAGLWKSSILDSRPLHGFVRSSISQDRIRSSGRALRVGATSLTTGSYRVFDESYHDVVGAVLASSAFPAMLSPVWLDGELWTDGGIREVTPLKSAIDAGATDVDVVIPFPAFAVPGMPRSPSSLQVALRSIEIMSDSIVENDLGRALMHNRAAESGTDPTRRVVRIRVIRPASVLTVNPLNFDPALLKDMWLAGFKDAKDCAA